MVLRDNAFFNFIFSVYSTENNAIELIFVSLNVTFLKSCHKVENIFNVQSFIEN